MDISTTLSFLCVLLGGLLMLVGQHEKDIYMQINGVAVFVAGFLGSIANKL